ncbi:MAG: hypothetical protein ACI8W1_001942, partial [Candidatus Azotimanducaceae bacterium]
YFYRRSNVVTKTVLTYPYGIWGFCVRSSKYRVSLLLNISPQGELSKVCVKLGLISPSIYSEIVVALAVGRYSEITTASTSATF